jgi:membrane-associated phospholipid phosphatase
MTILLRLLTGDPGKGVYYNISDFSGVEENGTAPVDARPACCIITWKATRLKPEIRPITAAVLILALLAVPPAAQGFPETTSGAASEATVRPGETRKSPVLKKALGDFLADTGRIWTSPFRIKARDVAPLFVFAATTTFLIAVDEDIRGGVKTYADSHGWVHDVGSTVTQMGGLGAFATAGLFFGAGLVFKDERARDTGYLAASAMVQSFLVSHALKGLTGRQRPDYGDGADHWAGPVGFFKRYEKANEGLYNSFPSGHASTAFSLATVVAMQYRHRTWVPVLAYTIAAGVSLSRVTEDRHWMSDAVVGALLGHFIARLVVRGHNKRQRLMPVLGCAGRSVTFGFQYVLDPAT